MSLSHDLANWEQDDAANSQSSKAHRAHVKWPAIKQGEHRLAKILGLR